MLKILILGGTGAMGAHLTNILAEKDTNEIVVTSRRKSGLTGNVRYVTGSAKEFSFLNTLLIDKWDVVIDFMNYTTEEFSERYNKLLESTKHYIFLSSARVYAGHENKIKENDLRLLDSIEDEAYINTDEYALSKARQEDLLVQSENDNWTIIRPYITYSEYRLQLGDLEKENWLYRAIKGKTIVFSEEILSKVTTLTYGYDVAMAISKLVTNENVKGQIFHVTNNNSIKWRDVLEIYLEEIENFSGLRPQVILQDINSYTNWHYSNYQINYDRLYDRRFNNMKLNEYVDVDLFTEVEDGLRECIKYFLNNPEFSDINWGYQAIMDGYSNEKTSLADIPTVKSKLRYFYNRYIKFYFEYN